MPILEGVRYVSPPLWRIALALYGAAGFVLGFIVSDLGPLLSTLGINPKLGMAGVVNLLLPACMVLITGWYPRIRTAWVGTFLLTLGFVVGALFRRDWHFWVWPLSFSQNLAHPILLAGMIAGGVIGTVIVWILRSVRRVGVAVDPHACSACGYSLVGIDTGVCPECGLVEAPAPNGHTESTADGGAAVRGAPR